MPRAYSDTMRSSKPSRRRSPLGTITGSNVPLRSRGTARFMRDHDVDILTLGQYLQPTRKHVPVAEFLHPDRFSEYEEQSLKLGFRYVATSRRSHGAQLLQGCRVLRGEYPGVTRGRAGTARIQMLAADIGGWWRAAHGRVKLACLSS